MRVPRLLSSSILAVCCPVLAAAIVSCSPTSLSNLTSATANFGVGIGQPNPRIIQIGFVNNTPFRAIFTFGAYEPLDRDTLPLGFGQLRLEGNTSSAQIQQPCRKIFSVGGAELVRLIRDNDQVPAIRASLTDPEALVDGVNFSGAPANDPLAAAPTEGKAVGLEELNGADYTCVRTSIQQVTGTGLLIFTFEQDASAPGGFRIDYQFIPGS